MNNVSADRSLIAAIVVCVFGRAVSAQLTPDRTYYGRGRAMPMMVRVPPETKGDAEVQLLKAGTAEVKASAPVSAGPVNLAAMFPALWVQAKTESGPPVTPKVLYAQLVVAGKKIGAAVVLQPMLDAPYAPLIEESGEPKYRPSRGIYSGIRAYVDRHIVLETTLGDIELAPRPDEAPNTAWNFLQLCQGGFYTDIVFHRVKAVNPTNRAPFVIQAGDPLQAREPGAPGEGEGGPGYWLDLEPSKLPHDFGVVSMARKSDPLNPNLAGSQFYISLSKQGTEYLDGKFTTFAQAVSGADVILKIAAVEVLPNSDRPKDPPVIKRARVIDAPPYGEGPKAVTRPEEKIGER